MAASSRLRWRREAQLRTLHISSSNDLICASAAAGGARKHKPAPAGRNGLYVRRKGRVAGGESRGTCAQRGSSSCIVSRDAALLLSFAKADGSAAAQLRHWPRRMPTALLQQRSRKNNDARPRACVGICRLSPRASFSTLLSHLRAAMDANAATQKRHTLPDARHSDTLPDADIAL